MEAQLENRRLTTDHGWVVEHFKFRLDWGVRENPWLRILALMHRPLWTHTRIKLDLSEGALVASHILLQKSQQRLSLLWAQIDAFEILNLHMRLGLLLKCAENQKEVPDIHAHLHAVGVILAIVGTVH